MQNYGNEREAAEYIHVSTKTLQSWRAKGQGPPYVKLGRLVRYDFGVLRSWAEARTRQSTSEQAA